MSINQPKWIIVHHVGGTDSNPKLDTSNHTFDGVNEYHRQKWDFRSSLGYYIGYHYFIDKNGNVKQGRLNTDEGAHCIGKNLESIGICMAGNFDVTLPTKAQLNTLKDLINDLKNEYNIPLSNIVPHRHFSPKTCYGKLLGDEWIKELLDDEKEPSTCMAEKDMIENQKSQINNLQTFITNLLKFIKIK